jgi:Rap1a immunity proteins
MKQFVPSLLLTVALVAPVRGDDRQSLAHWDPTGNDLVASCSSTSEFESGACVGFIQGVINGFNSGAIVQHGRGNEQHPILDLCVPNGVTNGQATKVILAYADKHPAQLHYPADVIVTKAISEAWPLEKSPTQGHACFSEKQ